MSRTKKHLKYFGKSFCADKVALTMFFLIACCIVGIIIVSQLPDKTPASPATPATPAVTPATPADPTTPSS